MKTTNLLLKTMGSCFIFASALALPAMVAFAGGPSSSVTQSAARLGSEENNKVTGKVTKKTHSAISVAGRMIALDVATTYIKAGTIITFEDVDIGDQVSVVVANTENGVLQAVTVEVLA